MCNVYQSNDHHYSTYQIITEVYFKEKALRSVLNIHYQIFNQILLISDPIIAVQNDLDSSLDKSELSSRLDETISEPDESFSEDHSPACSPGYITSPSGVTVELLGQDLWKKFYKLGTEMIITKAGR